MRSAQPGPGGFAGGLLTRAGEGDAGFFADLDGVVIGTTLPSPIGDAELTGEGLVTRVIPDFVLAGGLGGGVR